MKKIITAALLLAAGISAQAQDRPLWLRHPAISPDGQQIAFGYQGNLFVVPVTGGTARQLTTNAAYDAHPVWSPDGTKIAFASRREGSMDVWLIPATGGTPKRLTTDSGHETPLAFKDNETVIYQASLMPTAQSITYPGSFAQTYQVSTAAGRPTLFSPLTMEDVDVNARGQVLYHNKKGYENAFRKHQNSPITRDILLADGNKFTQLSAGETEFRTPRWAADGNSYFYLGEQDGTFNVYRRNLDGSGKQQITRFAKNPVRCLTVSDANVLCYSYDGEIYTQQPGGKPVRLDVRIATDTQVRELVRQTRTSGATEIAVSPKQKEIAFVMHGDVYVTSLDYKTTRRVTNTPEQERDITFAPDGRSIAYASERGGIWQIYETTIKDKDEKQFAYATQLEERQVVGSGVTSQYPKYSPDGKMIGFLENRGTLKTVDLKSLKATTCMDGKYMYSYSDGDVDFAWSPDSRWFLADYIGLGGWNSVDIALVKADGSGEIHNLTNSGYGNSNAKWVLGGKAMIFASDREGYRSHGSWGTERDAYIMFFDIDAYEQFLRTKEETEVAALAGDKKEQKQMEKEAEKTEEQKKKDAKKEEEKKVEPLQFDLEHLKERTLRLTVNSSHLGDFALSKKGDMFYYQSSFEGKYDLWEHDLKQNTTKLVSKGIGGGGLVMDAAQENLYLCPGSIKKYDIGKNKISNIDFEAEFNYRPFDERQYLYDHVWQQVKDKFYDVKLHGVDWAGYKDTYAKYLPHITTNEDFADLLSELLGELNASHTGSGYRAPNSAMATAQLGLFVDPSYQGDGLRVQEVLRGGPFELKNTGVKPGSIITAIDGQPIKAGEDYTALLDGKTGKRTRVTIDGSREVVVKPISRGKQNDLLYERWVERNRRLVDSISGGKIAYVHVRAMNSPSFREVFDQLLNETNRNRKAVIVDERHNGGGWLHDDLATLLSGKQYQRFIAHGQYVGRDPWNKWTKPSCVLVCEDDYSNGHGFPSIYKALGIGPLIGTPVAGTMTAVWWETLMDPTLYYGIPEVGCQDMNRVYGENNTLRPDIEVYNTPEDEINGYDRQLMRAIEEMMKVPEEPIE